MKKYYVLDNIKRKKDEDAKFAHSQAIDHHIDFYLFIYQTKS